VEESSLRAIILAGGQGRRLAPYTSVLPKPLMPVGDQAIVEILIEQLAQHGIRRITLCVGHLSHLIEAVLDGNNRGDVIIDYVREPEPLGTAGPLRLVEGLTDTFLMMNGDLLTDLDYGALIAFHRRAGNVVTIATCERKTIIDYGVLHVETTEAGIPRVTRYDEKPELSLTVSMGIYVMEPAVLDYIPPGHYFDFPTLVQKLLRVGEPVDAYPFDGFWLDIGRRDDYEQALEAWEPKFAKGRAELI
jgi:NDP-sugar pyrophosphorylase family protein